MITVKFITPTERFERTFEPNYTIKAAIEEAELDTDGAQVNIDGMPATISEMNSTFTELRITDKCSIAIVMKLINGN